MSTPKSLRAPIYKLYEVVSLESRTFKCKHCDLEVKAPTTSNLIKHFELDDHSETYRDFKTQNDLEETPNASSKKRIRLDSNNVQIENSPNSQVKINNHFRPNMQYNNKSSMYKDRLIALITFLLRSMLPITLILSEAFRDFIKVFDPVFKVPNIHTLKRKMYQLRITIRNKIREMLQDCQFINITIDIWTDATMRSFVGYMAHGINNSWEMVNVVLDFKQIKVRHTGNNIKDAYDNLVIDYSEFFFYV
jgi:hypothetical protein